MLIPEDSNALSNLHADPNFSEVVSQEVICSFTNIDGNSSIQSAYKESGNFGDVAVSSDAGTENGRVQPLSLEHEHPCASDKSQDKLRSNEHAQNEFDTISDLDEPRNHENGYKERDSAALSNIGAGLDSASGQIHHSDEPESFSSSVDGSEPIYGGEECILDSGTLVSENQEPVYEGEVVLAEQVDRGPMDDGGLNSKERTSIKQCEMCSEYNQLFGEIMRNLLKSNAYQLTVYGLFCLQDKVKERELCVFFRNNHFNTMFKYEGELYILVTDQGYINQPDLVWEKLTELAMALQQLEFEQQQEQHAQRDLHQPAAGGGSRLVTGPQVSLRTHTSSSKQDSSKSNEKCIVM